MIRDDFVEILGFGSFFNKTFFFDVLTFSLSSLQGYMTKKEILRKQSTDIVRTIYRH